MGRSPGILAAALLALACGACKTEDGYWSFALTRSLWDGEPHSVPRTDHTGCEPLKAPSIAKGGEELALLYVCLLAAPTAIDLVLLPITLPHDVWYVD